MTDHSASTSPAPWHVLVTGGAGYVGSALVPALLAAGHRVTVLDLFLYGTDVFPGCRDHPGLRLLKGDIRDTDAVAEALRGTDAVIHLACVSNDPSFDLDPELGRTINHDAFGPLLRLAKEAGVRRFIYASSSSVYGIKDHAAVTEDLSLEPLTDYARYKVACEDMLEAARAPGFTTLTIRPATVCGYAPRQRLDVVVNILTAHAVANGVITVFGGEQKRPNLHIQDMVRLYLEALDRPDAEVDGRVFNAGYENHSVAHLAELVRRQVAPDVAIETRPTDDIRSYHVSADKLAREWGFTATHTIEDAVAELAAALRDGRVPDPMTDPRYYNIRTMQPADLRTPRRGVERIGGGA